MDSHMPGGFIEGTHDMPHARTAGFTVLVFAQLYNCFNARSETTSAFSHLFVNPWLWGAVGLSLLLQVAVVNVGLLNQAFGTVPLTLEEWGFCAVMGSAVLWVDELRKLAWRWWQRRSGGA
jgi:magnesium-transporting ATPase (P-type)